MNDVDDITEKLKKTIKVLREEAWEVDVNWQTVETWLSNFTGQVEDVKVEHLHSLYLLSRFNYFGQRLIREMLLSAYRDHVRAPLIQLIRREKPSLNSDEVKSLYDQQLDETRFVGMGNPSESGAHLLYYFRQINYLKKDLFADLASEFVPTRASNTDAPLEYQQQNKNVNRYVFFDDLVGSGSQLKSYLTKHLTEIRKLNPKLDLRCVVLFATKKGKEVLRELFGDGATVIFELDDSFATFNEKSRYFEKCPSGISRDTAKKITEHYGNQIFPAWPLGYKDGQLMVAFSHNTPDNTLPVFWADRVDSGNWQPVFKRFDKQYT